MKHALILSLFAILACGCGTPAQRGIFVERSLRIAAELSKPVLPYSQGDVSISSHHMPFFEDAYGVRALCAAYKLTGDSRYLRASTDWADRMVAYQEEMIPAGAYYPNYAFARQPGQTTGDWYVADSATIAQAILRVSQIATPEQRRRYLRSAQRFFVLVDANYVNADGGVSDGIWGTNTESWWASTAIFGAFSFAMYEELGDQVYLTRALAAFDWLSSVHQPKSAYPPFASEGVPGVVMYIGEFYVRAWPQVRDTPRESAAREELDSAFEWMKTNQRSRNPNSPVDYETDTYMAGLPYLQYAMQHQFPVNDAELTYLQGLVADKTNLSDLHTWELTTWLAWSESARLVYH